LSAFWNWLLNQGKSTEDPSAAIFDLGQSKNQCAADRSVFTLAHEYYEIQ
jgi:hypothetical protein